MSRVAGRMDAESEMAELILWGRQHWDEPPTRMHRRGVEPGSEIGAPVWDEGWRRWLEGIGNRRAAYATIGTEESSVVCSNESTSCADCGGSGRLLIKRSLYRWPFRAALASIARRRVPDGWPPLDSVVWQLGSHEWSIGAVCDLLSHSFPRMSDPAFARGVILRALKNCRSEYRLATDWRASHPQAATADAA